MLLYKIIIISLITISISSSSIFALSPNDSLFFDQPNNPNFILKGTQTITDSENPSYELNGIGDYLILNSNLPEKLQELSISVWVKPIYKIGAPTTLSIISQSHAFNLSINNDQIEKNLATFSIYDGIKWHHVTSKSEIKNSWTHLAVTYSNDIITIFVNGIKENSIKVDGNYSLTHSLGIAQQNSNNYLKSESKILIGAFSPLIRNDGVVKNNFSGYIDDVMLYDKKINDNQILKIYEDDRIFLKPIIKNVESNSKKIGIMNQYGFLLDPDFTLDQKIEEVSSKGFKLEKLSSGPIQSVTEISEDTTNTKSQIKNSNNHTHNLDVQKDSESLTKLDNFQAGSPDSTIVCHIPMGDKTSAYTIEIFSFSLNLHLNHGDTLGECD